MPIKDADEFSADSELESACRSLDEKYCSATCNQLKRAVRGRSKAISVAMLLVGFFAMPYLFGGMNGLTYRGESFLSDHQRRNRFYNQSELAKAHKRQQQNKSLEETLKAAALPGKTVIITSLNAAWAENNTMIDVFLESFHMGNGTELLLKHLVIVAFDEKAFNRCIDIHEHCVQIATPGVDFSQEKVFMSNDFVKMVWRRIQFLGAILEKGYSFIFSDADILWLRDPFHCLKDAGVEREQVDMAVATDRFSGNPTDAAGNLANTGFIYARATNRTSKAYAYWYQARLQHPGKKEQDVFDAIKVEENFRAIGLRLRFLDTQFFGGFCTIRNTDLANVVTMHANCCIGLRAKLNDLRAVLHSWNLYLRHPPGNSSVPSPSFMRPTACPRTMARFLNSTNPPRQKAF